MRRTLLLPVLAFLASGCQVYDWWYERELRQVNAHLRAIPGVTVVASGGNEDVTFEDIYANVDVAGHGRLGLAQLTDGAFSGDDTFYVYRVGDFEPRFTSYGFQGVQMTDTGRPIKTVGYGSGVAVGGDSELSEAICCGDYRDVSDVISRFETLRNRLGEWPLCPAFAEVQGRDGTVYRYCTAPPETNIYPPERAEWASSR